MSREAVLTHALVLTSSTGRTRLVFAADGGFVGSGERAMKGVWSLQDGQITIAPDGLPPFVRPFSQQEVGKPWTETMPDGSVLQLMLEQL